jgi:hypothetical protein
MTAAAACMALALAGCEPAGKVAPFTPDAQSVALRVTGTSADRLPLRAGEPVRVTFSAPLDGASVGPRSVRVERSGSGRPLPVELRCEGSVLLVRVDPARPSRSGETLRVVLEGAPSPRALRSADGAELDARVCFDVVIGGGSADLVGPALVASNPVDGATEVTPGAAVELRFSEPLASGRAGDAVAIHVGGAAVPTRIRASADRRRLLVRPAAPLPPGSEVTVAVNPWVTDDAGNPVVDAPSGRIRFRTKSTMLCEIREEFISDEMADTGATLASWGAAAEPDLLVSRAGFACAVGPDSPFGSDLGDRETLRFQVLVRPEDCCGTLASGLRVRFAAIPGGLLAPISEAVVEGGAFRLEHLEPSFDGNRRFAALATLAESNGNGVWESDGRGGGFCDIPFRTPLQLDGTRPMLLDVSLVLVAGSRVAGCADAERAALVEGGTRERQRPLAALVTSGGTPTARSLWYDTVCDAPRWQPARTVELGARDSGRVSVEYQAAPAVSAGSHAVADETAASAWMDRLDLLPPWRFVRFRVRFEGADRGGAPAALDSVTLPFVGAARAR